jgi:hypothetical protein
MEFRQRTTGPERLVAEAALVFDADAGPLAGLRLVGFSLWRSAEGEIFVTVPSRPFGAGGERRFFDLIRPADEAENGQPVKALKQWILDAWNAHVEAAS